ncbi:hypothetical protein FF1_042704 [Malus domestica]
MTQRKPNSAANSQPRSTVIASATTTFKSTIESLRATTNYPLWSLNTTAKQARPSARFQLASTFNLIYGSFGGHHCVGGLDESGKGRGIEGLGRVASQKVAEVKEITCTT